MITGNTGGGIRNFGTLNLTGSTISGNSAHDGAGIQNGSLPYDTSTANITNCTISGNFTTDPTSGVGAGILNLNGSVEISNCTITNNIATTGGGGVWNEQPDYGSTTIQVKNTIIAQNAGATIPDVAGPFESQGFNLIGNTDGATSFDLPTDHTGTGGAQLDPRLDPNGLQDNGGLTLTIALLPDSPAIDQGTSVTIDGTTLATDQRGDGFPRTIDDLSIPNAEDGDGTDIRAFEAAIAIPAPVAKAAGKVMESSFNARWNSVASASGYRLDVSTTRSFSTYLAGYQDLDVGNLTSQGITGLSPSTKYFYRVRAYNGSGTSLNSNIIKVTTKA